MELKIVVDFGPAKRFLQRHLGSRRARIGIALALSTMPFLVYAVTKPNTFTDGTTISASQVNSNFDTVYNAVTTLETRPIKPYVWSGGCQSHGTASGWNVYCTNGLDFNTAGDYLSTDGSGTFTIKKDGYYRINIWALVLGCCNYSHVYLVKNGANLYYDHDYDADGGWRTNYMDQIFPFKAGDTFYVQLHNPGSYAFHSWNSSGQHSRLQVSYEGAL